MPVDLVGRVTGVFDAEGGPFGHRRLASVVTLSVVIPATDRRPTLERAVSAVERSDARPEEVIVVDQPFRLGPAAARNLGAQSASGDILVFVDADVEVHRDAFARIRAAFDEDPGLTAVFGSYDADPAARTLVSDFRNLLHHHVHHEGAGPASTFWAGLGAVRRDAFLGVGGFDEARFPHASIEDIELGIRLSRHSGRIVLDPEIQGTHLKRWTLVEMVRTDLFGRGVPWLRLLLDDRSHSTALNLGWRQRAGAGASVLLVTAVARRRFRLAISTLAFLVALDRPFYELLLRRRGRLQTAAGVALHVVHRLTSAAAVPVALAAHALERRRRRHDRS
jgi:cellulose synthase/poly-beta-1,6-N-acetylglucosamine synthase-like glycosyltransferase